MFRAMEGSDDVVKEHKAVQQLVYLTDVLLMAML
jgi:hypothetical protein